ncbi:hypothetical protein LCGC14_2454600, partial [marine sediment metagenome]
PKQKKFDPEGKGFDHATAKRAGLKRDATGHMQSILPIQPGLGRVLKGTKHNTFFKTERAERNRGNVIVTGPDKTRFSVNPHRLSRGSEIDLRKDFKRKK